MTTTTLLCCAVLCGDPSSERQLAAAQASVARIFDHSEIKGGIGTGAVVAHDSAGVFVLTAFHVVDPGERLQVELFKGQRVMASSRKVRILASAAEADLALLHVETQYRPERLFAVSNEPPLAPNPARVVSVGCNAGRMPSARQELITGRTLLRRPKGRALFWLTDGEVIHGRSGGPLIDDAGRLIGICRGGLTGGGVAPEGLYASLQEVQQLMKKVDLANASLTSDVLGRSAAAVQLSAAGN